jgi:hypothetical protein
LGIVEIKKLSLVILVAAAVLITGLSFAADDTVNVNVTINAVSQITVVPHSLNWTALNPGSVGGVLNLTIMNTGSANLTDIFAYVNTNETELARPYGSDQASNFSSAGLLVIKNLSTSKMYWAQRKEWNWTTPIPNIDLADIGTSSRAGWGFLKNTTLEYVWAVGNGTNSSENGPGLCNNTGALFAISDLVDTGSSGTRAPDTNQIVRNAGDTEYGYFSVNRATAPIGGMCVAVRYDCTYILVYKYDKRSNFGSCANADHFRKADLAPGQTDYMYADAWVPLGVPNGQMAIATMTVQAS